MKIAVCDDEQIHLDTLSKLVSDYAFKKDYDIKITTFSSGKELLTKEKYDLYFLDYVMPEMNGVELALELKKKFNNAVTICYLTSFENAAIDVINSGVSAQAFLTKPIDETKLYSLLDNMYSRSLFSRLVLKQEKQYITVYPQDVIYVEAMLKKCAFIFYDSREELKYTLSELENDFLPKNLFFKIHRSYIVNLMHVKTFDSKTVKMKNGDELPLTKHKEFKQIYSDYILNN